MSRIFVYEYFSAVGTTSKSNAERAAPIQAEGWAMLSAVAADFAAVGHDVRVALHERFQPVLPCGVTRVAAGAGEAFQAFRSEAAAADGTLIIAPECDGILTQLCRTVRDAGGRSLGPPVELVELASHKQRSAEWLQTRGVPVPRGEAWRRGDPWPQELGFPAVVKPLDGCGSMDVHLLGSIADLSLLPIVNRDWRVETYCPGLPASVSALCGPGGHVLLPPCAQRLSSNGRFQYLGGSMLTDSLLIARARRLASQAVEALPDPRGYWGYDVILGPDHNGRDDFVIEVNPRLTTSYVGLRAVANQNLGAALLAVLAGELPALSFRDEPIEFDPDGAVRTLAG